MKTNGAHAIFIVPYKKWGSEKKIKILGVCYVHLFYVFNILPLHRAPSWYTNAYTYLILNFLVSSFEFVSIVNKVKQKCR